MLCVSINIGKTVAYTADGFILVAAALPIMHLSPCIEQKKHVWNGSPVLCEVLMSVDEILPVPVVCSLSPLSCVLCVCVRFFTSRFFFLPPKYKFDESQPPRAFLARFLLETRAMCSVSYHGVVGRTQS